MATSVASHRPDEISENQTSAERIAMLNERHRNRLLPGERIDFELRAVRPDEGQPGPDYKPGFTGLLGATYAKTLDRSAAKRRAQAIADHVGKPYTNLPRAKNGYVIATTKNRVLVFDGKAENFLSDSPLAGIVVEAFEHPDDGLVSVLFTAGADSIAVTRKREQTSSSQLEGFIQAFELAKIRETGDFSAFDASARVALQTDPDAASRSLVSRIVNALSEEDSIEVDGEPVTAESAAADVVLPGGGLGATEVDDDVVYPNAVPEGGPKITTIIVPNGQAAQAQLPPPPTTETARVAPPVAPTEPAEARVIAAPAAEPPVTEPFAAQPAVPESAITEPAATEPPAAEPPVAQTPVPATPVAETPITTPVEAVGAAPATETAPSGNEADAVIATPTAKPEQVVVAEPVVARPAISVDTAAARTVSPNGAAAPATQAPAPVTQAPAETQAPAPTQAPAEAQPDAETADVETPAVIRF